MREDNFRHDCATDIRLLNVVISHSGGAKHSLYFVDNPNLNHNTFLSLGVLTEELRICAV